MVIIFREKEQLKNHTTNKAIRNFYGQTIQWKYKITRKYFWFISFNKHENFNRKNSENHSN